MRHFHAQGPVIRSRSSIHLHPCDGSWAGALSGWLALDGGLICSCHCVVGEWRNIEDGRVGGMEMCPQGLSESRD